MCKEKEESAGHVLSECVKLAQTQYKSRHDGVADVMHGSLCRKHGCSVQAGGTSITGEKIQ